MVKQIILSIAIATLAIAEQPSASKQANRATVLNLGTKVISRDVMQAGASAEVIPHWVHSERFIRSMDSGARDEDALIRDVRAARCARAAIVRKSLDELNPWSVTLGTWYSFVPPCAARPYVSTDVSSPRADRLHAHLLKGRWRISSHRIRPPDERMSAYDALG